MPSNTDYEDTLLDASTACGAPLEFNFQEKQVLEIGDSQLGNYSGGELLYDLKPLSTNKGFIDYKAGHIVLPATITLTSATAAKIAAEHINMYAQCGRTTTIGSSYCWTHLLYKHHLKIKPSTIQGAGKGLFAMLGGKPNDDIVFRKDDRIIEYTGERIDIHEVNERYGTFTGPYAVQLKKDKKYIDSATIRGIGSLANCKPRHNNARLTQFRDRVFVKATKTIRNGEEIFVDYGDDYGHAEEGTEHTTKYVRN